MLLSDRVLFLDGEAPCHRQACGPSRRCTARRQPQPRKSSRFAEIRLQALAASRPPARPRHVGACLARNPKAHGRFTRAFEAREVEKQYLAIVDGVPDGDGGTIDLPLSKVSTAEDGWRMVGDPKGKASVSHWGETGASYGERSLRASAPKPAAPTSCASTRSKDLGFPARRRSRLRARRHQDAHAASSPKRLVGKT